MIAINKIVLLIIFLIILLLAIVVLFGMGSPIGEQILLQNELRQCCIVYRSNDCPDISEIDPLLKCETHYLVDLVAEDKLNLNPYQLKSFCNCKPQCNDKRDNDFDGLIDADDPQCHTDGDATNPASYDSNDYDEKV